MIMIKVILKLAVMIVGSQQIIKKISPCMHTFTEKQDECRGVPSLKKLLDIRTSNYKNILVLKHLY